jgi:hypothetical protein
MKPAAVNMSSSAVSRIGQLVRLLSSDRPGEVVAAATAINRTLATAGADIHHLADVVERGLRPLPPPKPRPRPPPPPPPPIDEVGEMNATCLLYADELSERERGFIRSLKRYQSDLGADFEPSGKQLDWLTDIFDRLRKAHDRASPR